MHRRVVRPFGASIPATRSVSLLFALAVLWALYSSAREPATWQWLAASDAEENFQTQVAIAPAQGQVAAEDVVVPGPNDLDPAAMAEFRSREELITDRTELRPREMLAYWQLMGWSRTQSFQELEQRAQPEPAFTQLWDDPALYRAQPIRLRMHVRRVLKFDAKQNPLGLTEVFEAMGWTDESKSFPYTIIFADKPPGLPVGKDVEAEVVFAGYFLKNMAYTAFDRRRAAPLMIGRVHLTGRAAGTVGNNLNPWETWVTILIGSVIVAAVGFLFFASARRPKRTTVLPHDVSGFDFTAADPSTDSGTQNNPWPHPEVFLSFSPFSSEREADHARAALPACNPDPSHQ